MTTASTAATPWPVKTRVLATRPLHARATLAYSSLASDDV